MEIYSGNWHYCQTRRYAFRLLLITRVEKKRCERRPSFTALRTGLGSSTVTVKATDEVLSKVAELHYKPWGENRYTSGTTPTTLRFTGQPQESTLGGTEGLYFYGSRWYDPYLNRWINPDPIIPNPGNPLDFDRYSYVRYNPLRFVDPSGHMPCDGKYFGDVCTSSSWNLTETDLIEAIEYEYGIDKETEAIDELDLGELTDFYQNPIQYVMRENTKINAHKLQEICGWNPYCLFEFETRVKWAEFTDVLAVTDLAKMGGITAFTGIFTIGMGAAVLVACTGSANPLICAGFGILMGPNIVFSGVATTLLYKGTREYFLEEFTEIDVREK